MFPVYKREVETLLCSLHRASSPQVLSKMHFARSALVFLSVGFTAVLASPAVPRADTVCSAGQVAIGTEVDLSRGTTYSVIYDHNCDFADEKEIGDTDLCGDYIYGSEVTCSGSTISSAKVALSGVMTAFSSCEPAPAVNCRASVDSATLTYCCSK